MTSTPATSQNHATLSEIAETVYHRPAGDRGKVDMGWLKSYHSFSFGEYVDPNHRGFGQLRVINEDVIAPATGFGTHPHHNMEIITYMLSGELTHKDNMGHGSVIKRGEVQYMSAGTGVTHSEENVSLDTPAHLLQIWMFPDRKGGAPQYQQKASLDVATKNQWQTLISPTPTGESFAIRQDVMLSSALLEPSNSIVYSAKDDRVVYAHVVSGAVSLNGAELKSGDAIGLSGFISKQTELAFTTTTDSAEVILFDMAPQST